MIITALANSMAPAINLKPGNRDPMLYWIREFKHRDTGRRYRVYSNAQWIPSLRDQVAAQRNDPEWLDDMIYKHDPGLDIRREGERDLTVDIVKE